jgi:hypothetical protein
LSGRERSPAGNVNPDQGGVEKKKGEKIPEKKRERCELNE